MSEGPYRSLNLGILTDDDPERGAREPRCAWPAARPWTPSAWTMGWQVHGTDLREWDGPDPQSAYAEPGGKELPRVDGHLTGEARLALLVLVADCYPVALSDGEPGGDAALRLAAAGRRHRRARRWPRSSRPPAAAVGPGIGGCCYEVGPEVLEHFADVPRRRRRAHARPAQGDRRAARRRRA